MHVVEAVGRVIHLLRIHAAPDPWLGEGLVLDGPDGQPTLYRREPDGVWAAWRAHRSHPQRVAVRPMHQRHHEVVPSEGQLEPWVGP